MRNTNGYTREGVQKVRRRRFDTSKLINSNARDGQNENIVKLGNLCSGQVKLEGGERKAEEMERTTEEKEEEVDEEEVRAGKMEKTTEEEEEEEEDEDEVKAKKMENTIKQEK